MATVTKKLNVTEAQVYDLEIVLWAATVTVTTKSDFFYGETIHISGPSGVDDFTANFIHTSSSYKTYSDTATFNAYVGGTYTLKIEKADQWGNVRKYEQTIDIANGVNRSYSLEFNVVEIVPFATGSDLKKIRAMVEASHDGLFNLRERSGWAVGDTMVVHLNELPEKIKGTTEEGGYPSYSVQPAQDMPLTIYDDRDIYEMDTFDELEIMEDGTRKYSYNYPSTRGTVYNSFVVGFKNVLFYEDSIGTTDTNKENDLLSHPLPKFDRTFMYERLEDIYKIMLPEDLKACFSNFKYWIAGGPAMGSNSYMVDTSGHLTIPSVVEVFGNDGQAEKKPVVGTSYNGWYICPDEVNKCTQLKYYKNPSNFLAEGYNYNFEIDEDDNITVKYDTTSDKYAWPPEWYRTYDMDDDTSSNWNNLYKQNVLMHPGTRGSKTSNNYLDLISDPEVSRTLYGTYKNVEYCIRPFGVF